MWCVIRIDVLLLAPCVWRPLSCAARLGGNALQIKSLEIRLSALEAHMRSAQRAVAHAAQLLRDAGRGDGVASLALGGSLLQGSAFLMASPMQPTAMSPLQSPLSVPRSPRPSGRSPRPSPRQSQRALEQCRTGGGGSGMVAVESFDALTEQILRCREQQRGFGAAYCRLVRNVQGVKASPSARADSHLLQVQ
jgi:hypothetical protein